MCASTVGTREVRRRCVPLAWYSNVSVGFVLTCFQFRRLWHHYCQNSQALIFVVDSSDEERLGEAKEELHRIIKEDALANVVVLVLANKQDLPGSLKKEEICSRLNLDALTKKWHIEPTIATTGAGLYEGLDWLVANIK
jgi:GTPase SAR1 family protein